MTIYSGFSHEKLWFSIAMLVYQRVPYVPLFANPWLQKPRKPSCQMTWNGCWRNMLILSQEHVIPFHVVLTWLPPNPKSPMESPMIKSLYCKKNMWKTMGWSWLPVVIQDLLKFKRDLMRLKQHGQVLAKYLSGRDNLPLAMSSFLGSAHGPTAHCRTLRRPRQDSWTRGKSMSSLNKLAWKLSSFLSCCPCPTGEMKKEGRLALFRLW